jgi:hypothetical protein
MLMRSSLDLFCTTTARRIRTGGMRVGSLTEW